VLLLGNALLQGSTGVCPGDDLLHLPRKILGVLVKLGIVTCLSLSENVQHAACLEHVLSRAFSQACAGHASGVLKKGTS